MSNSLNGDRVKVEDEAGNVIWLRTRMGFGQRNRAISLARSISPTTTSGVPDEFALANGMLLTSIISWSGPDLDGKAITMEAIDELDETLGTAAINKLNELYTKEQEPEKKPTTSIASGSKAKAS